MKQETLKGFTFRRPNGSLDYRVVHSAEVAQSNAAFACERPYSHIELPGDWKRAYKQGFRIVRAKVVSGRTESKWKDLQPEED